MQARHVAGVGDSWLDPEDAVWGKARSETLKLMPTPLGLQPTDAIRVKWSQKAYGTLGSVSVSALHDGERLALRLEWASAERNTEVVDTTVFPDGAAVAFALAEDSPLVMMGAPGAGVNAWYWRADEKDAGRNVFAEGIGTSQTLDQELVRTGAQWRDGRWRVVLVRALRVSGTTEQVQLSAGSPTRIGVAIWEGSNGERAGVKAFSGDWTDLTLEAASAARS